MGCHHSQLMGTALAIAAPSQILGRGGAILCPRDLRTDHTVGDRLSGLKLRSFCPRSAQVKACDPSVIILVTLTDGRLLCRAPAAIDTQPDRATEACGDLGVGAVLC